jgi:hypothetical protein
VPDFYPLVRPLLRALPPETAHRLTLAALAAEEFDKRAAVQWPVAEEVKAQLPRTMKARINTVADDAVFADLASLVVDADLTSKDLTPLLSGISTAGSEADRGAMIGALAFKSERAASMAVTTFRA